MMGRLDWKYFEKLSTPFGMASTLHFPKCVDTGVSEIFFYDLDRGEKY